MSEIETQAKLLRALRIMEELDVRKKLYEELDALVLELHARGFTEGEVEGHKLELVDNFATRNTQFRVAGVHRFELKERKEKK